MDMKILQNMALFDFIIGGSTGEKTTSADDFERLVGRLLPKDTFTWISKFRSKAKRELLKVGTARKVDNRVRGYFVPMQYAPVVSERLKAIKAEYLKEKGEFLDKLPKKVDDWANHKDNQVVTAGGALRSDLIRAKAPTREELDRLLTFSVSSVMLNPTSFFGEEDALNKEVGGLAGQAATEISEDVNKSWKGSAGDRTTSRVLGLVLRIRQKAAAMGVLSNKFENLERMCTQVLQAVPSEGTIDGVAFLQLSALLNFCSEPENILDEQAIKFDPLDVKLPTPVPKAEVVALAVDLPKAGEAAPAAATQLDLMEPAVIDVAAAEVQASAETPAAPAPAVQRIEVVAQPLVAKPAPVAQSVEAVEPDVVLEF